MSAIRFDTPDGLSLEGEIREADGRPRGTAVLCHPHPRHGGSKDHPLLWAIRNELAGRRGLTVLSFNFRGIMGSEGEYAGGVDELNDVAAAVDRVRDEAAGPTVLAGWSFGANVALRHAVGDPRIGALVLIGMSLAETSIVLPPLPDREQLAAFDRPALCVSGAADQFSPAPELRRLARRLGRGEALVLPDTDHFFWKRERELAEAIGEFVERALDDA